MRWQPGMNLSGLLNACNEMLAEPLPFEWSNQTPRFLLIFTGLYAVIVLAASSEHRNTRPGEEHGSARWGNAKELNRRYRDTQGPNLLMTRNIRIGVDERDRKGSIQTTQEVEIYFNFVGRFVPPAFGEAELTPEELEEIRKREERKDRLHQNYLKRKASGAQKRYEDKIKGRKKAEIEAKKAAIRAEDIAKGVFVPVSSLPQREPMKGVQTA